MGFIVNPNESIINSTRLLILLASANLSEAVAVFDNGERVTMPLKTGQSLVAAFSSSRSNDSSGPASRLDLTPQVGASGSFASNLVT